MSTYLEVQLAQQPIELCKLLKVADLVGGGGEAKVVISEGYVLLNGEVEYQKRKKVYHNDIVEFNGETIQVIVDDIFTEQEQSIETPEKQNQKEFTKTTKPEHSVKLPETKQAKKRSGKRKPISF